MPNYWLLKSEPSDYSFDDLERDGRAEWDGVANNLALKHMRAVNPGDRAFFYHTGSERAIVGIAKIETEAYPDPDSKERRMVIFDVSPERRLASPVTLGSIKASGEFSDWELVRMPRLSVMPVPEPFWARVIAMSAS